MARPLKTGLSYFPHDVDAFNDEKIEAMRILHGNDGYAFFFMLCERIYRSDNAELDVSTVETTRILSGKLSVTEEKYNAMLATALSQRLFDSERYAKDKVLTSKGIKERAEVVFKKREFDRQSYLETVSTVETTTETRNENPQRKPVVKDTISEKKKTEKITNTRPTVVVPEWVDMVSWRDYLDMRKGLKKPATERAKELIIQKLEAFRSQGQDVKAILNQSVTSSWTDVYEVKTVRNNGNHAAAVEEKPEDRTDSYKIGE